MASDKYFHSSHDSARNGEGGRQLNYSPTRPASGKRPSDNNSNNNSPVPQVALIL